MFCCVALSVFLHPSFSQQNQIRWDSISVRGFQEDGMWVERKQLVSTVGCSNILHSGTYFSLWVVFFQHKGPPISLLHSSQLAMISKIIYIVYLLTIYSTYCNLHALICERLRKPTSIGSNKRQRLRYTTFTFKNEGCLIYKHVYICKYSVIISGNNNILSNKLSPPNSKHLYLAHDAFALELFVN